MNHRCGDNRFELIKKYKERLINSTNIECSKDEMAVIDDILFRFWQMGWLDKLDKVNELEERRSMLEKALDKACKNLSLQSNVCPMSERLQEDELCIKCGEESYGEDLVNLCKYRWKEHLTKGVEQDE